MKSGDWCSEIPIKRVARECCVDSSTVTRAYQVLKGLELIRRENPGRDVDNPFCQATAITEVRLPRALLTELSRHPNRSHRDAVKPVYSGSKPPQDDKSPQAGAKSKNVAWTAPSASAADLSPSALPASPRLSRPETQALWARASAGERSRFFASSRDRLTSLHFDADTQLTPVDRGIILDQLQQLATARPVMLPKAASSGVPLSGPRRLSTLELARARKLVSETVPSAETAEIMRQVIWAVEEGALRRFAVPLALNIALKKIREGVWSKPNRLPPQWMARGLRAARPEQCSAA